MVENAIEQVKEEVRPMVIATRELHGVVMNPEHVALVWCARFAGQIIFRSVKGADGLSAFQRAFQRVSSTSHACSIGRQDLVLGSGQE